MRVFMHTPDGKDAKILRKVAGGTNKSFVIRPFCGVWERAFASNFRASQGESIPDRIAACTLHARN